MDQGPAHLINGNWRKGRNVEQSRVIDSATEEGVHDDLNVKVAQITV